MHLFIPLIPAQTAFSPAEKRQCSMAGSQRLPKESTHLTLSFSKSMTFQVPFACNLCKRHIPFVWYSNRCPLKALNLEHPFCKAPSPAPISLLLPSTSYPCESLELQSTIWLIESKRAGRRNSCCSVFSVDCLSTLSCNIFRSCNIFKTADCAIVCIGLHASCNLMKLSQPHLQLSCNSQSYLNSFLVLLNLNSSKKHFCTLQ